MTRELMERRKAELIKQRDAFVANLQFANGAIAILEELLNPALATSETPSPPAEAPPAPKKSARTPKRKR